MSDKWLLELNASKCKTVFNGRNTDHGYKYSLHSAELENINSIKDLGIMFDPDRSFIKPTQTVAGDPYASNIPHLLNR